MAEAEGELRAPGVSRFLPALLSFAAFLWFAGFIGSVEHGPLDWAAAWAPSYGVQFAFRIDGLSLVFALLVTGIGALIHLYAAEYFKHHRQRDRLLILLVLFEIAMLGLVTADDALTLFVFWEGTTVTSFLLIGFDHDRADARAKAMQALVVTGLGGVALLAGLLILGAETGTYRLSAMEAHGDALAQGAAYTPAFLLIILAAFTKSAQIPFHYWLPNAMAAPTPVSAYLHSATMVKAGVYLLARLTPTLGGTEVWMLTLTVFGGATMLLSSVWAMRQTDLKLALAYTTVMGLGTLTMFLGVGGEGAVVGMATFLIVHAFYKAGLFLVIGILDKKAGSREADELSGLGARMPRTFLVAALAAASMAGLPPFIGFLGKEAMYEGALHGEILGPVAALAGLFANAMMIAIAGAVGLSPFIGRLEAIKAAPQDGPFAMWLGPATLAFGGLALGFGAGWTSHALVGPIATAILGRPVEVHLAFWHGLSPALGLSLLTFALGGALWWRLPAIRARLIRIEQAAPSPAMLAARAPGIGRRLEARLIRDNDDAPTTRRRGIPRFEESYDALIALIGWSARTVTGALQSGSLTRYLRLSLLAMGLLVGAALVLSGGPTEIAVQAPPGVMIVVAALIAVSAAILPFTGKRLLLITALGVTGAGVSLIFALYGAIDVAITQLMVETLVVVIIAVALLKLPPIRLRREAGAVRTRRMNAAIALLLGVASTGAVLTVMEGEIDRSITDYYEQTSAALAHGRNIVNVILVDFRALDTMGEIAVVAIAGLAALALLGARVRPLKDYEE